jgi:hypothetical protein
MSAPNEIGKIELVLGLLAVVSGAVGYLLSVPVATFLAVVTGAVVLGITIHRLSGPIMASTWYAYRSGQASIVARSPSGGVAVALGRVCSIGPWPRSTNASPLDCSASTLTHTR